MRIEDGYTKNARDLVLRVVCPLCGAGVDERCRTPGQNLPRKPHRARIRAAR